MYMSLKYILLTLFYCIKCSVKIACVACLIFLLACAGLNQHFFFKSFFLISWESDWQMFSFCWIPAHMPAIAMPGLGLSWEPGTQSRSLPCVAATQTLEPARLPPRMHMSRELEWGMQLGMEPKDWGAGIPDCSCHPIRCLPLEMNKLKLREAKGAS